ncbi:hypothetical protein EJB05_49084 [Eragrostis curvula]|uniref:Uncharacterized protein n=1 Tax=Eragrostis curvula TaxID=38414 RepID=A0A5J9T3G5_9POAL|nr:hypothetical protein EJB05_49084 [Eragrostis curvula]
MGPIRRSSKRKVEPAGEPAAAAAPQPRASKRKGEAEPAGQRAAAEAYEFSGRRSPEAHEFSGRRSPRVPRREYLSSSTDLYSSDAKPMDRGPQLTTGKKNPAISARDDISEIAAMAPGNQSDEIRDKSTSYLNESQKNDDILLLTPDLDSAEGSQKAFTYKMKGYKRGKLRLVRKSVANTEALTNAENEKGKEVRNDTTGSGILSEINMTTCIDSTPLDNWKGSQGSSVPEIIQNGIPAGIVDLHQENCIGAQQRATEFHFISDTPGDADVFPSNCPTQYGNNATNTDKCATSMDQDISEESFEQYMRSDGDNEDSLSHVKGCQAINHDHHPCEGNVAPMMDCKTSSVVATESVPVRPVSMINDVVPNLLPSNVTSDTGLLGNMASIQKPNADSLFSATSLPSFKGDIINTQSPKKNYIAEDQQGVSLGDHDPAMTEYMAESSQSIGFSGVNQLFSTYLRNSAEAEHGNRLTAPEDIEGTLSKCVAGGTDNSYCPMLQRSLVHESTVTNRLSESLVTESQPFLKTFPFWEHIDEMEIFKELPQQPHFHPLKKLDPLLRESTAFGLMVFFRKTADSIRSLNIQDDTELFKEKLKGLLLLEEYGFDVRPLRSRLETLLNIKNTHCGLWDTSKRFKEKITLKETNGKQRGTQINTLDTAIRQLERQANIFRCIFKASVSQKKTDALETSMLKTEACNLKKQYLSIGQQFSRIGAAPW